MHPFFRNLRHRALVVISSLALLAVASLVFSGMIGSVPIPLADMPGALGEVVNGNIGSLAATLLELRLSRALVAFVTGAALSLAGVMMQALLRNPLADPYVLGISAGASVGALAALLFMSALWVIDGAAFAGAVAVSMMLYLFARRDLRGGAEGGTSLLLLTGVILSSGCMAMVTLMLSIAPESRLRSMIFWMIGDLAGAPLRARCRGSCWAPACCSPCAARARSTSCRCTRKRPPRWASAWAPCARACFSAPAC